MVAGQVIHQVKGSTRWRRAGPDSRSPGSQWVRSGRIRRQTGGYARDRISGRRSCPPPGIGRESLAGVCCTARLLTLRSRPIVSWAAATADRSWRLIMCIAALAASAGVARLGLRMRYRVVGAATLAPPRGLNDLITLQNSWSGAGSNRRPSAFQALYRAPRPRTRTFRCPAQSHYRWSAAITTIVTTVPRCAAVPFRLWGFCGDHRQRADLWGFCGPLETAAGSSARLASPALERQRLKHPALLTVTRVSTAHEPV